MARPTGGDKAAETKKATGGDKAAEGHYEEWRMERKGNELEKLKKLRSCVKITDEEAEALNAGASSPSCVNPVMYFKPEQAGE